MEGVQLDSQPTIADEAIALAGRKPAVPAGYLCCARRVPVRSVAITASQNDNEFLSMGSTLPSR